MMYLIQKRKALKKLFTIFILLTCGICKGQNLVPNSSFELYSGCPDNEGQIDSALYWTNPVQFPSSSSDYLNECADPATGFSVPKNYFGYQHAHTGNAYAGIAIAAGDYREYIEVALYSALTANANYHFEMYVSLGENYSRFTSDNIGIYFSDTLIAGLLGNSALPFTPQINNQTGNYPDSLNWTSVSGDYTAHGGENYLVIGNFQDFLNNDSILYDSTVSWAGTYVFVDDVSLSSVEGINEHEGNSVIDIYPNPFHEKINATAKTNEAVEVTLYDVTIRKLLQQTFTNSTTLNTEQLAKGVYIYEVRNKNGVVQNGRVVKE
jgi:hypothetical protein